MGHDPNVVAARVVLFAVDEVVWFHRIANAVVDPG